MNPVKCIVFYILCSHIFQGLFAQQKNKVPAAVNAIFGDLPIDDPAQNSVLQPGEDSIKKIHKNIFITSAVSSTHCFLGEPVMLTYTLYSALQSTSTILTPPSFAGFSVNTMPSPNELVKRKIQGGKNYRIFILQQLQLLPLQQGVLNIEPMAVYNTINYKNNTEEKSYGGIVQGKPITIIVDSLPASGRPADFGGAVGDFTLKVTADSNTAAGENNTLRITVTGTGNFNSVAAPAVSWPEGCEHFPANMQVQSDKNSFPPAGSKFFTIPFVPAKEGLLIIPAMRLVYFDTQKKMYRSAQAAAVPVHVLPALHRRTPGTDTLPVQKPISIYYFLFAVIILGWLSIIFYKRKKQADALAHTTRTTAAPVEITKKEETGIDLQFQALQTFDDKVSYITAFKKIMTAQLQLQTGLEKASEEALLQQIQTADTALAGATRDLYTQCNSMLYAPGSINTNARMEMENKLVAIIESIRLVFTQTVPKHTI